MMGISVIIFLLMFVIFPPAILGVAVHLIIIRNFAGCHRTFSKSVAAIFIWYFLLIITFSVFREIALTSGVGLQQPNEAFMQWAGDLLILTYSFVGWLLYQWVKTPNKPTATKMHSKGQQPCDGFLETFGSIRA